MSKLSLQRQPELLMVSGNIVLCCHLLFKEVSALSYVLRKYITLCDLRLSNKAADTVTILIKCVKAI